MKKILLASLLSIFSVVSCGSEKLIINNKEEMRKLREQESEKSVSLTFSFNTLVEPLKQKALLDIKVKDFKDFDFYSHISLKDTKRVKGIDGKPDTFEPIQVLLEREKGNSVTIDGVQYTYYLRGDRNNPGNRPSVEPKVYQPIEGDKVRIKNSPTTFLTYTFKEGYWTLNDQIVTDYDVPELSNDMYKESTYEDNQMLTTTKASAFDYQRATLGDTGWYDLEGNLYSLDDTYYTLLSNEDQLTSDASLAKVKLIDPSIVNTLQKEYLLYYDEQIVGRFFHKSNQYGKRESSKEWSNIDVSKLISYTASFV